VQDFVPKKHLARFILGLVRESLDLKEIKSSYPSTLGQRPSFRAIARSRLFGSVSDTTRYASPMSGWLHGLFFNPLKGRASGLNRRSRHFYAPATSLRRFRYALLT
jgi:hypothetical protein